MLRSIKLLLTKLLFSKNKTVTAFLLLLLCSGLQAAPDIQHWTTANGARVFFVPAPELPILDLRIVFDGGAAHDGNLPGLAVLTNGLLSEGAGKLNADQISEGFDDLGAAFGNSAHRDMAVLSLRSLSEETILTAALDLFSTVLTQPTFPLVAFERERKRMLVAIKNRKESPGAIGNEAYYKALYKQHPYSFLPGGQTASVEAMKLEDISRFYAQYYVAKNAIIAIVGDLNRQGAEKIVAALVAKLPEGNAAPLVSEVSPLQQAGEIRIDHPSAQTHILMGQPGVKRGDPDYFSLYIGNHILGGNGLVSRLSAEIREKRGLSYSTYSYFSPMRRAGPFTLGLQTKNASAAEALKILRQELASFVDTGPTLEELDASKKNITGGFPLRLSSNKKIIGYIAMIGFYNLPLDYLQTFNDKIEAVTVDSIKDAFQRRVHPDKMITIQVGGAIEKPKENKDAKNTT